MNDSQKSSLNPFTEATRQFPLYRTMEAWKERAERAESELFHERNRSTDWQVRAERAEARVAELERWVEEERAQTNEAYRRRDVAEAERDAEKEHAAEGWAWIDTFCGIVPGVDDVFKMRDFLSTRTPREGT